MEQKEQAFAKCCYCGKEITLQEIYPTPKMILNSGYLISRSRKNLLLQRVL